MPKATVPFNVAGAKSRLCGICKRQLDGVSCEVIFRAPRFQSTYEILCELCLGEIVAWVEERKAA